MESAGDRTSRVTVFMASPRVPCFAVLPAGLRSDAPFEHLLEAGNQQVGTDRHRDDGAGRRRGEGR